MGRNSLIETVLVTIIACVIIVDTVAARQAGCCTYDQYEGKMYMMKGEYTASKGHTQLNETEATFHRDYEQDMLAMEVVTRIKGVIVDNYTLIEDFNKMEAWYIKKKSCSKIPVTMASVPAQCISGRASLLAKFNLASNETVQDWVLPNHGNIVMSHLTVEVSKCTPIQMTTMTQEHSEFYTMASVQYGNLTKGIADPTVFDVPKFCPL